LEFLKVHEKVVQPGGNKLNINPYFLGFTILSDIRKRWDEKHKNGESEITGFQKVLEVTRDEDDISFLRNYLTQDICNDLKMFAYVKKYDRLSDEYVEVESIKADDIVENMIKEMYNYRSPSIAIVHASEMGLELELMSPEFGTLDHKHAEKVMGYLYECWGGVVDLKTIDENKEVIHLTYDEAGFSH
jgi:stage V sporulation protein R